MLKKPLYNIETYLPLEGMEWLFMRLKIIQNKDSYGISGNKLSEPFIAIKPIESDLVLFNSRLLHAVRSGSGTRISISFFVCYSGSNNPLKYWS